MPRYHALDTAINLWRLGPAYSHATITKNPRLLQPNKKETSGPAIGYVVENMKEEYFEGRKGVDFLGPAMPFYLVKAGKELFGPAQEDNTSQPSPVAKDATPIKGGAASTSGPKSPLPSTQASADTTLSSIDTDIFTPRERFSCTPGPDAKDPEHEMHPSGSSNEPGNAVACPKPIAIKVDLSRSSFMSSINTNQRQELCVTIFYNGELTHSRILRADTYSSLRGPVGEEKIRYYSGRRINTSIEVPWVLDTRPRNGDTNILSFDERWNKINQLLRAEADEWGYYGRFRSPIGEYLEELSSRAAPDLEDNERLGGGRAGIIDVVITLGQSVRGAIAGLREPRRKLHADYCGKAKQLVIAPEELRPKKKARIVAQFNQETPKKLVPHPLNKTQRPKIGLELMAAQSSNKSRRSTVGQAPKIDKVALGERSISKGLDRTVIHNSIPRKKPPTPSVLDNHNKDGPSEPLPLFAVGADGNRAAFAEFQSLNRSELPELAKRVQPAPPRRASLPMSSSSPFTHQRLMMPRNVPQKRYKNSEVSESLLRKRPKLENELKALGCLPVNFEQSASSTRFMRAASSPATQISFSVTTPGQSAKESQRLHESKSTNDPDNPLSHVRRSEITKDANTPTTESSIVSIDTEIQSRSQNTPLGLDGNTDDPKRVSRPRSATTSTRTRPSLSKKGVESAAKTPASSMQQFAQEDHNESAAPRDRTRIVFYVKSQEAAHAFVSRRKFEDLHLRDSATGASPNPLSTKRSKPVQPPPNMQLKSQRNSKSSAKQTKSTQEGPAKSKGPAEAQSKRTSGPASSRKKGNATSEASQTLDTAPKSQSSRKRETVSCRELKELFSPHKCSEAVDSSFGSSFKAVEADVPKARPSRTAKPTYATPENPGDVVNSMEAGSSEIRFDTPLEEVGVTTMSRQTTVFLNRLAGTNDKDGLQGVHATGELLRQAMQVESTPSSTPSQSIPHDQAINNVSKEQVNIKYSSAQPSNKNSSGSTKDAIYECSTATEDPCNSSSHITPSERSGRSYTVDSEGRKVPTPKDGLHPVLANSPTSHPEEATPKLQQSAQPRSTDRRSSLSQMVSESPSSTASTVLTLGRQKGEISTAARNTKAKTPSARSKASVSDGTMTFSTPARGSAASTPTTKPASQSKAKTKPKVAEVSIPSGDDSKCTLRNWKSDWKPISLCNGSALTYAVGEAFPGTAIDKASNEVCRTVKAEREGVFRASGVLMGVRFVVGL